MRLAFNTDIVRSITRSLGRYLAILAIVGLGAGFYAGLRMCAPDMRHTVDHYLDQTSFMDFRLLSTLGFSDADVEAVRALPGVDTVMPAHMADVGATIGDLQVTARVHSLEMTHAAESVGVTIDGDPVFGGEGTLNRPTLVAGRWPEKPGECLIDRSNIDDEQQLGKRVTITQSTRELADVFVRTEFTVVGVVNSSYYISFTRGTTTLNNGNIDRVLWIARDAFSDADVYSELFVLADGSADTPAFADEYDEAVAPIKTALEDIKVEREGMRLAEVKAEAQATLDEKRVEYADGKAEADEKLADGQKELDDAAAELADGEAEIADGWSSYYAGRDALASERARTEKRFDDAQREIDAGRSELEAQKTGLDELGAALPLLEAQVTAAAGAVTSLQTAYDAALAAEASGTVVSPSSAELLVSLTTAQAQLGQAQAAYGTQKATYDGGMAALAAGEAKLDAAQADLDAGRRTAETKFAAAESELASARRQLVRGRAEIVRGKAELADGRQTFERERADALAELEDAREKLDDAQAEIDDIEKPKWYVLDRGTNEGFASFKSDAQRIDAISYAFPAIFFLVAGLVALTTMTRMVDEERTIVGTYKALGYRWQRINSKYLYYAGSASIVGAVLGVVIASQTLPRIVWRAYTTMYTAPSITSPIDVPIALTAGAVAVGTTLLSTMLAVGATLRESPATLMLPRAPKPGKRILLERIKPIWSRTSFIQKVTARNLFRYKKRLLMTVIGIAGCTGLLLTGFGIQNSIADVLDIQYGEIYGYNITVGLETDEATETAMPAVLDDPARFQDYIAVHQESAKIRGANGEELDCYVSAPSEPARLNDFIDLRNRKSGEKLQVPTEGVLLTEKASLTLDVEAGDTITVELMDDGQGGTPEPAEFTVAGIAEQNVFHVVYMDPASYVRSFAQDAEFNRVLGIAVLDSDTQRDELSRLLLEQEQVSTVQFIEDITASYEKLLESLDAVVFILIFSAGLLAFVVLYNLTNINITERKRELATIKVLGFYDIEVNSYIYRETAALTLIGTVVGLVLGIFLKAWVISTVEVDMLMFGRTIRPMSYVYSAALTLLFALVVNLAMAPRLKNIDMVESLKSVE